MDEPGDAAWLPFSVGAAATAEAEPDHGGPAGAWAHLLARLEQAGDLVTGNAVVGNEADLVAGLRHLQVLTSVALESSLYGTDKADLTISPGSTDEVVSWGMDCPDALYLSATLRHGRSYRLAGSRGTARYVGLQTMDGAASTANALVDELEVAPDGTFEVVLSPAADKPATGNWLEIAGDAPNLVVRHFYYDWDAETPASLTLEALADAPAEGGPEALSAKAAARQLGAIGDFVYANLKFFLDFGQAAQPNEFLPPFDGTAMGGAAENRPVIGRYQLAPDEALVLEVDPPEGVYWSFALGNPWWETIHYGRHQSSLNAHQAAVDEDGRVRVVISAIDPGVPNWLDNAGHSNGPMILRCVRTETAPTPRIVKVPVADVRDHLPAGTAAVAPEQRAATLAARRVAIQKRFSR
ncbi:MAG TPA: DUF1214 domain-containing protein [Marmoricola sp.]|jgi:hypothetical protein|nr:DUF1214 domain-containing protein [Marmoricola sp.]